MATIRLSRVFGFKRRLFGYRSTLWASNCHTTPIVIDTIGDTLLVISGFQPSSVVFFLFCFFWLVAFVCSNSSKLSVFVKTKFRIIVVSLSHHKP